MKKFFAPFLCAALSVILAAGSAFADAMIPIVAYKCLVCEKNFYGFKGDELDSEELNDPDIQLKRVFTLADWNSNLPPCSSNFKAHVFEMRSVMLRPVSEIIRNASRIAVVKGGRSLQDTVITAWICKMKDCGSTLYVYTLNEDSLMQKDWEQQIDHIFNLKNKKIPKCQSRYSWGHAFAKSSRAIKSPVTSLQIAQLAEKIYYVK